MVYITVMQSPIYHQMTLEEFLFQSFQAPTILNTNVSNTRTYAYETVSEHQRLHQNRYYEDGEYDPEKWESVRVELERCRAEALRLFSKWCFHLWY